MTGSPDTPGGVAPDSFDVVEELVARFDDSDLEPGDSSATGDHPLALLIQGTIESISSAHLGQTIVGFTEENEEQLRRARRKLEVAKKRPLLQELLFASEQLCEVIREVDYGAGEDDEEANSRFFEELFPDWLEQLREWASAEGYEELAVRVAAASEAYLPIAGSVASAYTPPRSRSSKRARSKSKRKSRKTRK